jgi:hypothetical protein
MGLHESFWYLKHKLWPKERPGVKLPIWLSAIKSQELLWFTCLQVACHISLERSWQGQQLCFRPHFNQMSSQRVMGLQSRENPNLGNLGTPNLRVPRQNDIWVLAPMVGHREYYKKEGVGFLQVWAMVNLVSPCLSVACPCTKSAPIMH